MKVKMKLGAITEDLDGVKSVLDSMGNKVSTPKSDKNLKAELDKLSIRVDKLESDNKKRFKEIETSLNKILTLISKKTTKIAATKKSKPVKKSKPIKILSVKQIHKNSLSFFKHKKYQDARDGFLDLVDKKYKLDESFFYIAESLYFQKRYKDSIYYYKKSVNKNDHSKFLSTLLLHSGISFKNSGDKVGAKRFFDSLIGAFPKSKEAKTARNYLKKL